MKKTAGSPRQSFPRVGMMSNDLRREPQRRTPYRGLKLGLLREGPREVHETIIARPYGNRETLMRRRRSG
jgi:hypothetical protein